jgi:hypothetical protein
MYDLDNPYKGVRECPKCRFTMEYLSRSRYLDRDEGYLLDYGVGWDPDDHLVSSFLIGDLWRWLWRTALQPLLCRFFGNLSNRRYRKILRAYPHTLICPHCRYLLKAK